MSRIRMTAGVAFMLALAVPLCGTAQTVALRDRLAGVDTGAAMALSTAFRAASRLALPAVVFIAVEEELGLSRPDQVPPQLRQYFGGSPGDQPPREGTGSGFIVDSLGHILTNNHVIADASRITVRLVDGREYEARVVGADLTTDIAVIRIERRDGETLPVATMGDSDAVRVGDWVLALGNPLGLDFTVTAGIVSAKGRQVAAADGNPRVEAFIQTDAVINPGNSGGPLIDLAGHVVGVNTAIFGSDRFVGYGFAVPIGLARRVAQDLLEFGYLRRPMLGIQLRSVLAVDAELYGLDEVRGGFVSAVQPGGPAAAAGLRAGDVILALDDAPVADGADLIARLAGKQPRATVAIGIARGAERRTLEARLGEFERSAAAPAPRPDARTAGQPFEQRLGFGVRVLTAPIAETIGYRGQGGVVVGTVVRYGGAWYADIRQDMIVLALNGHRVESVAAFEAVAATIRPGSPVSVTVFHPEWGELVQNYRTRQ
jgi:serine protease Do